jgi:hypothetical protein
MIWSFFNKYELDTINLMMVVCVSKNMCKGISKKANYKIFHEILRKMFLIPKSQSYSYNIEQYERNDESY